MSNSYNIRNYQSSDKASLIDLLKETERLSKECYISPQALFENMIVRKDYRPEEALFLAENARRVIGYINTIPELAINRAVFSCLVHPDYRRKGLGTMLVGFALNYASKIEAKVVHTYIYEDNKISKEFLTNLGFKFIHSFSVLRLNLTKANLQIKVKKFEIRRLKEVEERKLTDLQNRSFDGTWGYNPNTIEDISKLLNFPGLSHKNVIVACDGNILIGYCWMRAGLTNKRKGYVKESIPNIHMLGVEPDYRSQGVGEILLMEGLKDLKNRGFDLVELIVDDKNNQALKLYRSQGFKLWKTSLWYEKSID
ncbi:MAG: GNAT family N-acetyltransferase [Candidatus Bathyarchaeota archaeon]|nr:GNAT family N-acetyltransferase [Candidatus Bathyarchaeota archaeon]